VSLYRSGLAVLLLTLASVPANAQVSLPTFGLGVGLNANTNDGANAVDVRFPFRLSNRWRLEPSLGFAFTHVDIVLVQGSATSSQDLALRYWRLALLLARMVPLDSTVHAYFGPRLALIRNSQSGEIDTGLPSLTDFSVATLNKEVALVAGGEVALTPHLTVGGELSLSYIFRGDVSIEPRPLPDNLAITAAGKGHTVATGGAVIIRWFLGH
jgi:Outer membrane protein beta-barrel domain